MGGNTVSVLVGISGVHGMHPLGSPELAAALAVATASGMMLAMRCLHPPGGARALMMVLGRIGDPAFALYPVLLNCLLLVLAGIGYTNATRRPYTHRQLKPAAAPTSQTGQIMTRNVQVASMERYLVELPPLFGSTGHHHLPIIGEGERLVGMITQSDLVPALGKAADPAA
ncbi:HPP family protein [Polaromonas sp. CG_23.6]|uniref:HPP family protein n=1 Tax=unclassified Polaromonas TaxID=2638319 RepID=UPI001A29A3D9|nr:CBS-domain-containing membrane protein [Polaromonas sp. CG_9.7]MBG6112441.1 CBS-domain-containing membrane protein [Polaromonas sp. CG_9.2]MDH6184089.1 CBS-domain-containing membrane protein [Polaromonas sp. CG_23.6]